MFKKFKMEDYIPVNSPMITGCKLSKDDESLEVDHTMYRSMIGSLLYVIATRPDVMQDIGLVARLQFALMETHVNAIKIIFRYLKGTMDIGLWYPKGEDFTLIVLLPIDVIMDRNYFKQSNLDPRSH